MSDPEQKGNGREAEEEAARTGAGKPTGNVPRGIEVLIKKAAVDPQFRSLLLEKRAEAAGTIGLELHPSEIAMLAGIPQAQLEAIISRTRVDAKLRPILMGAAAAVMLVALGADLTGCRESRPPAPTGSRPDQPPSAAQSTTASAPATTNAVTNANRPIMPVEGGARPDRPPSIPAEPTTAGPATTNPPAVPPATPPDTDAVVTPQVPPVQPQTFTGHRPDRP
jgi:hypothetical protein